MAILNTPLGMGINYNPITDSPYVIQDDVGVTYAPPGDGDLTTEGGTFILTEGLVNLSTE